MYAYSPINHSTYESKIFTRNDLDQTLAIRKFEPVEEDSICSCCREDITIDLFNSCCMVLSVVAFAITLGSTLHFYLGFKDKTRICSLHTSFNNIVKNKIEKATIFYPCEPRQGNGWGVWAREEKAHTLEAPILSPIVITIFAALGIAFIYLGQTLFSKMGSSVYNQSVERFYQYKQERIQKLSPIVDGTEEVLDRDVALTFPYLEDSQLPLLKFSHLKEVKAVWERLFQKKLDAGLFSKQQLAIWRLFQRLLGADDRTQVKMLKEPNYAALIAAEPLFFQEIIQKIGLGIKREKKLGALCSILKGRILTTKVNRDELIEIILQVREGSELKLLISNLKTTHLNEVVVK